MTIIDAAGALLKSGEIGVHRREDLRAEPVGAATGARPDLSEHPTDKQGLASRSAAVVENQGKAYFGPERRIAQRRQTRRSTLLDTRTGDRRTGADSAPTARA